MAGTETTLDPSAAAGADDASTTAADDAPDTRVDDKLHEIYDRFQDERNASADDAEAEPAAAASKGRDASGRFTKDGTQTAKTGTDTGAAQPATDAAGKPVETQPKAEGEQTRQALQAPEAWRPEWKEQFGKIPAEGQHLVAGIFNELQADYTRKTQSLAGERKRYETLNAAIAPIEAEAKKFNVSTDTAIKGLWDAHMALIGPNKMEAIKRIAADYDIDLLQANSVVLQPRTAPTAAPAISPEIEQRIAGVEGKLSARETADQEAAARRDTTTAQAWIDEKTGDGVPLRPHFQAVHEQMKPLIFALRQSNPDMSFNDLLSQAYDAACASNPTIRQKMIEDAAKVEADKRINKDRARGTRSASASSASVSRNGASSARKGEANDVDQLLNSIYDKHHGTA